MNVTVHTRITYQATGHTDAGQITVHDVDTPADAIDRLADLLLDDAMIVDRWDNGTIVGRGNQRIVELTLPAVNVGDPDPDQDRHGYPMCETVQPSGINFICTLEDGHAGNHAASDGERIVGTWTQDVSA